MFSGFSTCKCVFSPPSALHIWHTVSWTAVTLNASGSTTHGTEILAKYFPLSEHTCAASSDLFLLGRLKIFNLCFFLSACLSFHRCDRSVYAFLFFKYTWSQIKRFMLCFCGLFLVSHTSFPSSHFIRHRSVEAYYASGWNSRTWAVNESFIGSVSLIYLGMVYLLKTCLCLFSKWKIHLKLAAVIAFLWSSWMRILWIGSSKEHYLFQYFL